MTLELSSKRKAKQPYENIHGVHDITSGALNPRGLENEALARVEINGGHPDERQRCIISRILKISPPSIDRDKSKRN